MKTLAATVLVTALLGLGLTAPAHAGTLTTWGAIGDSITYGTGTSDCASAPLGSLNYCSDHAYPRVAGVASIGKPGQALTVSGWWAPLTQTFPDELAALQAQGVNAVVVEIGVNDLGFSPTDAAMEAGYATLVAEGAAAGVHVVLSTITPFGAERASVTAAMRAQRIRLNRWIRVQGPHVDYANALGGNVLAPAYDSGDGLHPSDAGAARMAQRLSAWLASPKAMRAMVLPVCVRAPCQVKL